MAECTSDAARTTTTTPNDFDQRNETAGHVAVENVALVSDEWPADGEGQKLEEALETHEVVELNKFTTKREWIEEKIKLLERMPPIEVFAAVDSLTTMSDEVPPGLPTRAQLDHWLEEHDRIEKETEIFDAEDMSKLKKLTKAATQRNLSPEDTDLIELTLTTLLALDKLLHLLRDRSEMLDLLALRLTWEEQRVAAWRDRRSILDDLHSFLATRARWSVDTYELPASSTPSPPPGLRFLSSSPSSSPRLSPTPSKRRGSTASLTSISSDTSNSIQSSSVFSRSTRYKLAELLSHDAALFSGRLTTLNHGKIMQAGKILDRLIDTSRTPVPDEILDEQDRLEDKGIKDIETVGKFAMAVVMQWKRADEYYNDTKKDQVAAQALLAELNNAKLQPPTARSDAAFMSRAQALTKRLAMKGDPALSRTSFPRPVHPLFSDQDASNEAIVKTLSVELAEARKLVREAETGALAYHAKFGAVKRVEALRDRIYNLSEQVKGPIQALVEGVHDEHGHGDGSPLDLSKEICLDPARHAAYLALLPTVAHQIEAMDQACVLVLREGRVALRRLEELSGIDLKLKREFANALEALEGGQGKAKRAKEDALTQAQKLKEARRLWDILNDIMYSLEDLKMEALDGMETQRWRAHEGHNDAPLTPDPDSPEPNCTALPTTLNPDTLFQKLEELEKRLSNEFKSPFIVLAETLEHAVHKHLQSSSEGISRRIGDMRGIARLWESIIKQFETMVAAKCEAHDLGCRIDMLQTNIDDARQETLDNNLEDTITLEADFGDVTEELQAAIRKFTDSIAERVTLVSRVDSVRGNVSRSNSISKMHGSQNLNGLKDPPALTLPFELSKLDICVRAEINSLALGLAGGIQAVYRKMDYLRLSRLAKATDVVLESSMEDIRSSEHAFSAIKISLESTKKIQPSGLDTIFSHNLSSIKEQLDRFIREYRTRISRSVSVTRLAFEDLQTARGSHDSPVHSTIVVPRAKLVDEVIHQGNLIDETCVQMRLEIVEAEKQENVRLSMERERLEAEAKFKERKETEELVGQDKEHLETDAKATLAMASRPETPQVETNAKLGQQPTDEEHAIERLYGEAEERERQTQEQEKANSQGLRHNVSINTPRTPDEDVFGLRLTPSTSSIVQLPQELTASRARIMSLRSQLRSLSLNRLVVSQSASPNRHVSSLPTLARALDVQSRFSTVVSNTTALPPFVQEDSIIDSELKSLRSEVDSAHGLVQRIVQLAQFADKVAVCDHAVSDLLEHTDSYPAAPPTHRLASSHVSEAHLPYEEQLANRLTFTKGLVAEMSQSASSLVDDPRVVGEETRIRQALTELDEICADRINGKRSRPASSTSSTGRISFGSIQSKQKPSLNPFPQRHPRTSETATRRIVSGIRGPTPGPSSRSSNRSVSGPSGFSSLFNSTFASRQRTTSLASIQPAVATPAKRPMSPVMRPRTATKRPSSPTLSEASDYSFASTPSRSTWSLALRPSFGTAPRSFQIPNRTSKRKAYVANPKSKLDVAVGNVVNNFKVPVTIQAVDDGWKDQSGKYWIGEDEPKLCFCRILRSQTVMVRVGGGWCELSNFLGGHFAELLTELPPSPPRKEERWISSATVLEAAENLTSTAIVRGLKTPEPQRADVVPVLQLSTPNGTSPQSLKTSSSPGDSPGLTPFQFLRKAGAGTPPITPSTSRGARNKPITPNIAMTPGRTNFWRP